MHVERSRTGAVFSARVTSMANWAKEGKEKE
jgi:hypothetical protein